MDMPQELNDPASAGRLECDIAVAGAGLAGLTAALALGVRGFSVAVISPAPGRADLRTTA